MGYFSFQENRCGLCRETFPKEGALESHIEAVHGGLWWKALFVVLLLAGTGGVYYYFTVVSPRMRVDPSNYDGALTGDHWHADYTVEVCGETQRPFLYSDGDVHTHGNGQIHIHPHSSSAAGPAANLKAFIESIDGVMSDTKLMIPTWGIDSTEGCNGQPSEFVVFVNGYQLKNPTQYPPQEGDSVRFVIRPRKPAPE